MQFQGAGQLKTYFFQSWGAGSHGPRDKPLFFDKFEEEKQTNFKRRIAREYTIFFTFETNESWTTIRLLFCLKGSGHCW